ncbi:hypothetical protein IT882_02130 [Microbacterium schleiferi]|uniref:Uncharacterized protein n=1 Tax=Microbacterium schleiferi TaxID=69362 RepID=A0A7S8MXW1_9MICO|nr:hypothetical protein [Microbacterium schleiferi]QPE04943.1 hypothetical protein IT882_02130 [Microbacterium schleiferi]
MSARDAQFRDVDGATMRVRSIWLTQLSLGVSIIIISVVALGYEPELFESWLMLTGVAIVVAAAAATLVIPWARTPRWVPLIIPFADIVGIGFMSASSILPLGFFWVFPIMWIGLHFTRWALAAAVATIAASLLTEAATSTEPPEPSNCSRFCSA